MSIGHMQILERKNDEIDEVKQFYRSKLKEQEDLLARSDEKSTFRNIPKYVLEGKIARARQSENIKILLPFHLLAKS